MAFRHSSLGAQIAADPVLAHEKLVALFLQHGSRERVAAELGVDRGTVSRWIDRLVQSGLTDPREDAKAPRRGRPPRPREG